jgi:hypothetical protein
MRSIDLDKELTIAKLNWTQTKVMRKEFKLLDLMDELASLTFGDKYKHSATGGYFNRRFVFFTDDPRGNLYKVSSMDDGTEVAVIQFTYAPPDGKALISIRGGATYRLTQPGKGRREWALVDSKGEELCRVKERFHLLKHQAEFSCPEMKPSPIDRLLMALIVWYAIIVLLGKEAEKG